jgi:uncharacterized protein with NRDE domain
MCLLLMAVEKHPFYRIIIAANRDEFFNRPTQPAGFWPERPEILAGKDLLAGGSWLGVTRGGKIAALTNYRDPASIKEGAPSRGKLVSGFLEGNDGPKKYLAGLTEKADLYNGFNLVVGDIENLYWYSNRGNGPKRIMPGIYGLSNQLLDTPWPKVVRGKEMFRKITIHQREADPEIFFEMLKDDLKPDDRELPNTGVELEWERILSPIFIASPTYGTRCSSVIFIDTEDNVTFIERTYHPDSMRGDTVKYAFKIDVSS